MKNSIIILLFFYSLTVFAQGKKVTTVVHIGDSHIQAGYMSQEIRTVLQNDLGGKALGLITPYKLARTNSPINYSIKSDRNWGSVKISTFKELKRIDFSGILLYRKNNNFFSLRINAEENPFTSLLITRDFKSPALKDVSHQGFLRKGKKILNGLVVDTIFFQYPQINVLLRPINRPKKGNVYGSIVLKNNSDSLLYHAIGMNGAMYYNYTREEFVKQLVRLSPNLFVISLGTNEACVKKLHEARFRKQVDKFLDLLQHYYPNTPILLTSPPPSFKKHSNSPNKNVKKVSRILSEIAKEKDVLFFDLYKFCGGIEKSLEWRKNGLMYAKDGIHFSEEGYTYLGNVLGQEIEKIVKLLMIKN